MDISKCADTSYDMVLLGKNQLNFRENEYCLIITAKVNLYISGENTFMDIEVQPRLSFREESIALAAASLQLLELSGWS